MVEYTNHSFYKYNSTISHLAPPQEIPFIQSEITNETLTPTSISFLVPILTIPFLNGPLIGYNISYTGGVFDNKLFQSLTTLSTFYLTATQKVFNPAGNNITVTNLFSNFFYSLSISASNSEGTTNSATLSFELPPASKYYLYEHIYHVRTYKVFISILLFSDPGAPINVSLLVVSYQQINVSWSIDVSTVNGLLLYFNIYYNTVDGYSNVLVYNATDIISTGPYTMSVTGLSPNTLYSINVTIVNEVSEGIPSSAVQAKTLPTGNL